MNLCDVCRTSYADWRTHARTWRHRISLFIARISYF